MYNKLNAKNSSDISNINKNSNKKYDVKFEQQDMSEPMIKRQKYIQAENEEKMKQQARADIFYGDDKTYYKKYNNLFPLKKGIEETAVQNANYEIPDISNPDKLLFKNGLLGDSLQTPPAQSKNVKTNNNAQNNETEQKSKQETRADILYGTDEEYNKKYYGDKTDEFPHYKKFTKKGLEELANAGKYMHPVEGGRISSPFGKRIHPISKKLKDHHGVDIAVGMGTPIYAPMDGTVTSVKINGGYGKFIEINHGKNSENVEIKTQYGHLSEWLVKKWEVVKKGQIIGKVGSTGASTGPHLHFNVLENENYVNPLNYIDAKNKYKE